MGGSSDRLPRSETGHRTRGTANQFPHPSLGSMDGVLTATRMSGHLRPKVGGGDGDDEGTDGSDGGDGGDGTVGIMESR